MLAFMDAWRQAQGAALEGLGSGPTECGYHVIASGRRLRDYGARDARPCLLIVAAPIKRPYLWDLAPPVSAVRYCLDHRLRVYLLEWTPPRRGRGNAGLAEYAGRAIGEAVANISRETGTRPFLIGHSLGGTFAAIFCALDPSTVQGLVLLGAPLCFRPGMSRFRDAMVAMAPPGLARMDVVPGSLLSQLSALASPETFVWSRLLDATLSSADPLAWEIHARVERWALDEVPLAGRLVQEILQWLYREDRFCSGTLSDRGRDRRAIPAAASHARGRQSDRRDRAAGIGSTLHPSDAEGDTSAFSSIPARLVSACSISGCSLVVRRTRGSGRRSSRG